MARTYNNNMDNNPAYAGLIKASSQQQQQRLYDSTQQQHPSYDMIQQMGTYMVAINPLSSQRLPESKQLASSSNVQHHSNCVGEQVKWLIIVILLITSTLMTGIVLFELYYTEEKSCDTQVICPQATNTTQMAQDIAQAWHAVSCNNTIDEMILQFLVNNNITTLIDMVSNNTQLFDGAMKNVTASLQQLSTSQSILENISNENKATINTILVNVLEGNPVFSCQDIKNRFPTSLSGYYHINSQLVYCEMGELCNSEGGWTRLAYLDMTDSTIDCPPGFKLYQMNEFRACGRPDDIGSCVSIQFPSNGISYSEVCGRVVGYQFGSPDALYTTEDGHIDSPYADGVSITQGNPRKHVWTLIVGRFSDSTSESNCPCNTPPGTVRPTTSNMFIVKDYFCESGDPTDGIESILYPNDPLWDGKECGSQEQDCCLANGLPWFHKTLTSTTDYLELRVCSDEASTYEDTPISLYELYVK